MLATAIGNGVRTRRLARLLPSNALRAVRIEVLVALLVVGILLVHLPYLEAWPTAHNDEARELNAFWVASGADPTARGLDPEFGPDPLYKGGLQGLTVGLALRVWGLGLLQGRLVSLAWGGLLLALVFAVGRRLCGSPGGLLALLFLALSHPFLLASHMIRPDVVLAAILSAALLLALRGSQDGPAWVNLAAGLLLGLGLDVHLNTLAFMPLVSLVYPAASREFWRKRPARLFVLGVLLGVIYFLVIRVIPNPSQFASSSSYWLGVDKRPPILTTDFPHMVVAELGRFQAYFTEDRRFELLLLLTGLVVAGLRSVRERRVDPLLVGMAAAFVLFVTIVSSKSEFYVVLFYPWLSLLLASSVVWLVGFVPRWRPTLLVLVAALAPFVFGLQDNWEDLATAASNDSQRGYSALIDELRPYVPADASILGPPLFWIGFHNHAYTDYYVWERLRAQQREKFASYAARLKPDLLVLDAKSRYQIGINSPGYLESSGVLLKSVRHVGFDRVEIWKLS